MKYFYLTVLICIISIPTYSKGKGGSNKHAITIDLSKQTLSYIIELPKNTDEFTVDINYPSTIKDISVEYVRIRDAEQALHFPAAPGAPFVSGTNIQVANIGSLQPGDKYNFTIKYIIAGTPEIVAVPAHDGVAAVKGVAATPDIEKVIDLKIISPIKSFWSVTYGNNFIFTSSINHKGNKDFFVKQNPTTLNTPVSYNISSRKGEGVLYAPSVTFVNMTYPEKGAVGWAYGASLGLETDSATPTVTLGLGCHFNYRVQFMAGLAMYQTSKLRPEYVVGETVTSLLTEDQLTRKVYTGDAFISLSIRLNKTTRE